MDVPAIEAVLREKLPDCEIELVAESNKLSLKIVSNEFAGLNRVKRQQKIYALLDDRIKSGEIHAISMITQTLEEASS
jgi:acid stress-induced BolA-like protein IbaG/YrbA